MKITIRFHYNHNNNGTFDEIVFEDVVKTSVAFGYYAVQTDEKTWEHFDMNTIVWFREER